MPGPEPVPSDSVPPGSDPGVEVADVTAYAGEPDGFARLWTPHRMVYIKGENKPASSAVGECPF
ncbi:MAG: hit family protein, partial [Friedmanniella sp.]|nr:hit family protein [Friedmanniella sp.]